MFVVRSGLGRITAAYLDEQFPRQEWLPIDSRSLQHFLAAAPACCFNAVPKAETSPLAGLAPPVLLPDRR